MSIRIIGGHLKGRNIKTPASYQSTLRPTSSRVRESLFNILNGRVENRRVLDLYAGMGCLGIEALSRGAKEVVFVERESRHLSMLRENLESLDVLDRSQLVRGILPKVLDRIHGSFDLIFIDPPYEKGLDQRTIDAVVEKSFLSKEGIIIVEKSKHSDIVPGSMLDLFRSHRIGDTDLCFFTLSQGAP